MSTSPYGTTLHTARWWRWMWLSLSVVAGVSMWGYVTHIWAFGQPAHFSDLYAPWWGAHELWLHHRDPYSLSVCREIQTTIYGSPLTGAEAGSAAERAGGFAYPLFVTFLLWPVLHLRFMMVQALFAVLFPAMVVLSLRLWLFAMNWRVQSSQFAVLAIFLLGSFPVLQGLWLQNLSLLVAFLIAGAVASIAANRLLLGGCLLGLAAIKPPFVFMLVLWLALWAVREWKPRQGLVWGFLTTMLLLVLGSEWLSPGWVHRFVAVLHAYTRYTYGHSLLDLWFTSSIAPFVRAVLMVLVLALCWRLRECAAQTPKFVLACSLVLATTLVVIPTLEPHAQLMLLPGFLLALQQRGASCLN